MSGISDLPTWARLDSAITEIRRLTGELAAAAARADKAQAELDTLRTAIAKLAGRPSPPTYDKEGNYEGRATQYDTSEHRTTGGRAWCHNCQEWCYPESYACPCCEPRVDPDDRRALLAGAVLDGARDEETSDG